MERGAGAGEEERPGEAPQKSRSKEEAEARTASRQLLPRGGACAGGGAGSVPRAPVFQSLSQTAAGALPSREVVMEQAWGKGEGGGSRAAGARAWPREGRAVSPWGEARSLPAGNLLSRATRRLVAVASEGRIRIVFSLPAAFGLVDNGQVLLFYFRC